jgi:hypothetical protein
VKLGEPQESTPWLYHYGSPTTLPSVDSNDPIEDLDPTFGEEDAFDAINTLLPLTVVYGEYILADQQSNVEFNSQHLQLPLLSDVECVDDFQFRKESIV